MNYVFYLSVGRFILCLVVAMITEFFICGFSYWLIKKLEEKGKL